MDDSAFDRHVDYKEMYLQLMRASENAIRLLIEAQQLCEAMYVDAGDAETDVP